MIKKSRFFTVLSVVVLLLFSQILQPITSYGLEIKGGEDKSIKLFQVVEQVELDAGIVINKDTYLYGDLQDDTVLIQFADTQVEVPIQMVKDMSESEDVPEFHEPTDQEGAKTFQIDSQLYALDPNESPRIMITNEMDYPIGKNELGLEVFYLGNIAFYLNQKDRLIALEKAEIDGSDEAKEEPADEPIDEPTEEPLEEPLEEPNNVDGSQRIEEETEEKNTDEPTDTQEQELEEEEENNQETEAEQNETIRSFTTFSTLASTDPWKGVSSDYFKVTTDNLVIYDNRSGSLKPIGKLTKGQVYPRVSDYGNWHRIQFGDIYGYVRKRDTVPDSGSVLKNKNTSYKNQSRTFKALKDLIVYDNTSGSLVPYGIIDKGQSYPIATDYGNWWRVVYADRVGYVRKSDVQTEFLKTDKFFRADATLPIYDNRTGKLVKVGEVKKGQEYPRVSDYGNWHRIQFGNIYGYVHKSQTSATSGSSIKNMNNKFKNESRTITALQNATVYDNTSGKLVPFGTIEKGASFPIATDYGNWWRVIYADRVGYVRKDDVKASFNSNDKYFRATKNSPIYDNRTGKLIKVGETYQGQVYPIVRDYGNWWRVQFGDIYGYVRKSHTGYATGKEIKNLNSKYKHSQDKIIAKKNVTVYDNTSGRLVPFGILEEGTVFPIATDYGNWWRIIYLDRVGYVRKSEVELYGISYSNYNISLKDAVAKQMKVLPQTDEYTGKVYVHWSAFDGINLNTMSGTLKKGFNMRTGPSIKYHSLFVTNINNYRVKIANKKYVRDEKGEKWWEITRSSIPYWVNAQQHQVEYYMNPNNFINDKRQAFQFLDLRHFTGVPINELKALLDGKGSLHGTESFFSNAAKRSKINELYLISHALLETGNGESRLAKGVEVGKDKNGNLVLVNSSNKASLRDVKKTYNMFGIGAIDSCPLECGAKRAYKEGWFSVEQAILGGAEFAKNNYIYSGQNTLYKMRWNPVALETGNPTHQYATDVGWASKQVAYYESFYSKRHYDLRFDIPVYK